VEPGGLAAQAPRLDVLVLEVVVLEVVGVAVTVEVGIVYVSVWQFEVLVPAIVFTPTPSTPTV
jgi:hypothetical protein